MQDHFAFPLVKPLDDLSFKISRVSNTRMAMPQLALYLKPYLFPTFLFCANPPDSFDGHQLHQDNFGILIFPVVSTWNILFSKLLWESVFHFIQVCAQLQPQQRGLFLQPYFNGMHHLLSSLSFLHFLHDTHQHPTFFPLKYNPHDIRYFLFCLWLYTYHLEQTLNIIYIQWMFVNCWMTGACGSATMQFSSSWVHAFCPAHNQPNKGKNTLLHQNVD